MNDASRRALTIFGLTSISAFWVNAAGHAWMLWRGNPLVREHKATLQYRSALLGDSMLLPLVNVLLDRQMRDWDDGASVRRGRLARAALVGASITAVFHAYQGALKLTNWTMPRPWRWNALGYYHALYMAAQFTVLAYFAAAAAAHARANGLAALCTRRLLAVAALLGAFAALLYKDYY